MKMISNIINSIYDIYKVCQVYKMRKCVIAPFANPIDSLSSTVYNKNVIFSKKRGVVLP
jgi:hypothetical protein